MIRLKKNEDKRRVFSKSPMKKKPPDINVIRHQMNSKWELGKADATNLEQQGNASGLKYENVWQTKKMQTDSQCVQKHELGTNF